MIEIIPGLWIDEAAVRVEAIRASGPGGQHVNKSSTAVQLRFDSVRAALPAEVRERLQHLAGQRMTAEGVLVIDAREHRSQLRNREAAMARLVGLLRQASRPPRVRRKTRPTAASRRRRVEEKRQQSQKKERRRRPGME